MGLSFELSWHVEEKVQSDAISETRQISRRPCAIDTPSQVRPNQMIIYKTSFAIKFSASSVRV